MTILYVVTGVIFAVVAVLATIRIVMGPTILDRVIASDVLLTTLILVLGAEMVINGHTRSIALMVVLAATATFSTVAVARYVTNQDRAEKDNVGVQIAEQTSPEEGKL